MTFEEVLDHAIAMLHRNPLLVSRRLVQGLLGPILGEDGEETKQPGGSNGCNEFHGY